MNAFMCHKGGSSPPPHCPPHFPSASRRRMRGLLGNRHGDDGISVGRGDIKGLEGDPDSTIPGSRHPCPRTGGEMELLALVPTLDPHTHRASVNTPTHARAQKNPEFSVFKASAKPSPAPGAENTDYTSWVTRYVYVCVQPSTVGLYKGHGCISGGCCSSPPIYNGQPFL